MQNQPTTTATNQATLAKLRRSIGKVFSQALADAESIGELLELLLVVQRCRYQHEQDAVEAGR